MAEIRVNPTRMELKKLKTKLTTARRGHKLLKDKCDELMKQFLDTVREAGELRKELNTSLSEVIDEFKPAAASSDPKMVTEALLLPPGDSEITVGEKNVMSVIVPVFEVSKASESAMNSGVPYGYAFTSRSMDKATKAVCDASYDLVRLAEMEKACQLMCLEIERTRRRVNALEYIMIPGYEATIKQIAMKLDENERSNQTRLMKVKDMMLEGAKKAEY